jgi:hypothetical protein
LLPVEVRRVSDRLRGYYLDPSADPTDAVLVELRHPSTDDEEADEPEGTGGDASDGDADREASFVSDAGEGADAGQPGENGPGGLQGIVDAAAVPAPVTEDNPTVDGGDATRREPGVSGHDVEAPDGWLLRPRVTGACCAVRARHVRHLDDVLMAGGPHGSGPELLAAAEAHGLDVVVEDTAVVNLPVHLDWEARVDGTVVVPAERPVEWSPHTHPAALPGSLLGWISQTFGLRPTEDGLAGDALDEDGDAPFLSIVTRTQGRRLHCLEDLLTCLAGQNDRDFELLLTCHRTTPEELAGVRGVVASAPAWLRAKVRVLEVERPGRASPLNDGFAAARGRYVVALDDDDTVLSHYVSTFKSAAVEHDGRVLRTVAVRQDVAPVGGIETLCAVSIEDPFREWPLDFNLVDHLVNNYSPIMTIAFPRGAHQAMGMRFDETLDTTEDWDMVVRCASVLGVVSVREVTSVYRWWVHTGESSRALHTQDEWASARRRVQEAFEETVLLVPPEETRRMVASLLRARQESNAAHHTARSLATSQHEVIQLLDEVKAAHDEAVATAHVLRERTKAAQDKVQEVRDRLRKRHASHLRLLREADLLLAERPHARPARSIVDLPVDELKALVARLRDEPVKRRRSLRSR